MSSLDIQIGGDHYKKLEYQPVELSVKMRHNFIQGCINKYVARYKNKDGVKDLHKCIHYAQMGSELRPTNYSSITEEDEKEINLYVKKNNFAPIIGRIIIDINTQNWLGITAKIKTLIEENETVH